MHVPLSIKVHPVIEGNDLVIRIPLAQFSAEANQFPFKLNLQPLGGGFDWTWPSGKNHYSQAMAGEVTWNGRTYAVRLGKITIHAAGRDREYVLIVINNYPTLHFVEGEDGRYASIITRPGGRATIRTMSELPSGYLSSTFLIMNYNDIVQGKGAARSLAVVVNTSDDHGSMIRHAILRWEGRQEKGDEGIEDAPGEAPHDNRPAILPDEVAEAVQLQDFPALKKKP